MQRKKKATYIGTQTMIKKIVQPPAKIIAKQNEASIRHIVKTIVLSGSGHYGHESHGAKRETISRKTAENLSNKNKKDLIYPNVNIFKFLC